MTPPIDDSRPGPLRWSAWVVGVQGVALVALALVYAVFILFGDPDRPGLALFGASIGLIFGVALLLAARGLLRGRRAAYSPIVLAELIAVPVGIGMIQGGQPLLAI